MTTTAAQLLRLLGSGIQPAAAGSLGSAPKAGSSPFADLLKQAQDGTLESRIPVTISGDAHDAAGGGVTLSEDQLARIAQAADKLEAAGVRTALITIDGQRLVMDVHQRQITGRATEQNGILAGVDGMMDLGDCRNFAGAVSAPQNSSTSAGTALSLPGMTGTPASPSLLKLLSQLPARMAG